MNRKNPYHNDWAKRIVSIVSQYPVLYDKKHSDYRNKCRKMEVWREIANYVGREMQVNMTAAELEKRWLGWKSTYISEHRRLHTPPVDMNVKKWYLYKAMGFMEPYISHHRKTFKTESDQFGQSNSDSKADYNGQLMKPLLTTLVPRPCICTTHGQSNAFPCPMDHSYLQPDGARKSELADSTSTIPISQVLVNFDNQHGIKSSSEPNQSNGDGNDAKTIDRKSIFPDSSGLATRSPSTWKGEDKGYDLSLNATNSFFKEEGKDKCKCIIEERLEQIPLERRTLCLIEIFQVIQKYEYMSQ